MTTPTGATGKGQAHAHALQENLRIIIKHRWTVLAVLVIVVAGVAFYNFTAVPLYKATVQILIERHTPRILDQRESPAPYDYTGEEFYNTQYKLLEGKALAKKVVDKLRLKSHPYYQETFSKLAAAPDELADQRSEEALVGAILAGVEVSPIRSSSLVNVSFSHPDPKFAAQVVNAIAQCFVEQSLDMRFAASQEAASWLQTKLVDARKKLEDSEAKLNHYKKDHNIVALEDKETITAQKLSQLNQELVAAQTRRMEAETRFQEVSQGKPIPQVLNNALVQNLKALEAKIIAEQSELSRKYGEKHPRILQLKNELAATRAKIGAETNFVVQSIKNEYRMAQAQEENLKKALEAQKDLTQDMSDRGIRYRVLLRDVETNRALYENMLKSMKETAATENIPATNIRIVYPAVVPDAPVYPRKARNLLLAVLLGLAGGVGLALTLESLDTTLKTPEDVEHWLGVPNLAIIPHMHTTADSSACAAANPGKQLGDRSFALEPYRAVRTNILFSTPGHSPRLLLVTSSLPVEGKTWTASNLATVMAKAEPKILLVDADLRRPCLHKMFNIPQEPGLSNFLVGDIDELPVVASGIPQLSLIPCGHIPPNPSELLGSERMREFLARAQEQFGRVIIDSPPVVSVTDATILATLVDGVIMVVKAETVPRKAAMEACASLLEIKANLLGVLLNDVSLKQGGYYYQHYYRYNSSYYHAEGDAGAGEPLTANRFLRAGGPLGWMKSRFRNSKSKS